MELPIRITSGRLTASQHQNLLMANPADQVISQKDTYEYDNTGQWVCRTNRGNPQEVERVQYIYK